MVRARALAAVLVALLAGLLSRYGLAGAAHTPPNDACGNFGNLPEGSSSSSAVDRWPPGVSCTGETATAQLEGRTDPVNLIRDDGTSKIARLQFL